MDKIWTPFHQNNSPFLKTGREYTANKRKKISPDRKSSTWTVIIFCTEFLYDLKFFEVRLESLYKTECFCHTEQYPCYKEGNVVPVHAMKSYSESTGIALIILELDNRRRWVVSFTPQPFYRRRKFSLYSFKILSHVRLSIQFTATYK